jgi:hypothetical protein
VASNTLLKSRLRSLIIKTVTGRTACSSLTTGSTIVGEVTCSCLGVPTIYRAYGSARNVNGDPDYFFNNPELVATNYAMNSAVWFFEAK